MRKTVLIMKMEYVLRKNQFQVMIERTYEAIEDELKKQKGDLTWNQLNKRWFTSALLMLISYGQFAEYVDGQIYVILTTKIKTNTESKLES